MLNTTHYLLELDFWPNAYATGLRAKSLSPLPIISPSMPPINAGFAGSRHGILRQAVDDKIATMMRRLDYFFDFATP